MKPALIPYHKGGLKAVHLGIQELGNDLASKATSIFSTVRTSLMFTKGIQAMLPQGSTLSTLSHKRSSSVPPSSSSSLSSLSPSNTGADKTNDNSGSAQSFSQSQLTQTTTTVSTAPTASETFDPISASKFENLNSSGRIDYILQVKPFIYMYLY